MSFLVNFLWKCHTFVIPTLLVLIITPVIYFKYGYTTAWLFNNLGMVVTIVGNLLYITLWLKRGSHLSFSQRLGKVLTFKRW
jgi:hypothetical protein